MKNKKNQKFSNNKVAEQICRLLSSILQLKAKDPRLGMININEVRVTHDLSYAKVYFTIIGDSERKETEALLNKMAGFLRSELATKLTTRTIPELRFYYDTVIEKSVALENLFEQIKSKDPEA
jgi:ribosome-binding factor A